jgi:uncharacterized protein
MNRFFKSIAALLLLFTGPAVAQQAHPAPSLVTVPVTGQKLKPALWQVSDADTTIFLFGTIHALPQGLVWLHGPVSAALDSSDELITEIPEAAPEEVQALVLRQAVLPPGQTLRSLLPPAEYQATTAALTGLGLPAPVFDRFKPWYVALILTTLPLQREGYAVENGVEGALTARMKELGKPHLGLETLEFQLGMFDKLPPTEQRKFLSDAIAGQNDIRAQLDQLVSEWGQGNAMTLAELLNDDTEDPAARELIFTSRNRSWVTWLRGRLERPGQSFVAVGAGHLAGKDSVIDLLAQQGVTVTRVQ